jgi:hypothetical protein
MRRTIRLRTSLLSRVIEYFADRYRARMMRFRLWLACRGKTPF